MKLLPALVLLCCVACVYTMTWSIPPHSSLGLYLNPGGIFTIQYTLTVPYSACGLSMMTCPTAACTTTTVKQYVSVGFLFNQSSDGVFYNQLKEYIVPGTIGPFDVDLSPYGKLDFYNAEAATVTIAYDYANPCITGSTWSTTGKTPCNACGTCSAGSTYMQSACNATSNIWCKSCTPCGSGKYVSSACTATNDTGCLSCTVCGAGKYSNSACTGNTNSNIGCNNCSTCASGKFMSSACTAISDTSCGNCTDCAAGMYVSSVCTSSSNTVCRPGSEITSQLRVGVGSYVYPAVFDRASNTITVDDMPGRQGYITGNCYHHPVLLYCLQFVEADMWHVPSLLSDANGAHTWTTSGNYYNQPNGLFSFDPWTGVMTQVFSASELYPGTTVAIDCAAMSSDGNFVIVHDTMGYISKISTSTLQVTRLAGSADTFYAYNMKMNPTQTFVVWGDYQNKLLRTMSIATGAVTTVPSGNNWGNSRGLDISQDGSYVWWCTNDGIVKVVISTGQRSTIGSPPVAGGMLTYLTFSPDYTYALVTQIQTFPTNSNTWWIDTNTLSWNLLTSRFDPRYEPFQYFTFIPIRPLPCVTGSTYSDTGVSPCTACIVCLANQYKSVACNSTSNGGCTTCGTCSSAGTYRQSACTATSNIVCNSCTPCGTGQFLSSACTATSDNVCLACTVCGAGLYASSVCTGTSDTVCSSCTVCGTGNYTSSSCSATSNTVCSKCGVCDPGYYGTPCTVSTNTVCDQTCSTCSIGQYLRSACNATSNTGCLSCTVCSVGQYASSVCTTSSNTVCTTCTVCGTGNYSSSACSATSNTVCSKCGVCDPGFYGTPCTVTSNTVCDQACSVCSTGKYPSSLCNATKNTVCSTCDTCTNSTQYVSSPCTVVSNTVCSACDVCGVGKYTSVACAGTTNTGCGVCPSNSYCTGLGNSQTCPVGSVSLQGSSSFLNCSCPTGTSGIVTAQTSTCSQCSPGSFCSGQRCQC